MSRLSNIVAITRKHFPAAPPDDNIKELIRLELVYSLYRNFPLPLATMVVAALIITITLWDKQPSHMLLGWFGANILLSAIRGVLLYRFSLARPKADSIRLWAWLFAASALLSGLIWGALPWLFLDTSSPFNVLFIILSVLGVIAASAGTHAAFLPAYFAFAIPLALLLAARLGLEGAGYHVFTYMMMMFLAVFLYSSANYYQQMKVSIRQRFEKIDLIRVLASKHREAEAANRDKSRFLAATSHDLRQPLHALDLYLAALSHCPDAQQRDRLIARSKASSKALGELLNTLLDISQLDAGAVEVRICAVSLPAIITEVVEECIALAHDKGLGIRRHMPPRCTVRTDPVLFQRMLRNLLSNAIRHCGDSDVLVGVRHRNGIARVEVYDTGPGIPEKHLERIFSEFYQLDNPERDRNKGVGLGLATVRKLSLLLDHPVHVRSRPGKGSCFSIDLPLHNNPPTEQQTADEHGADDISGLFVLVVDDDQAILDATYTWLRSLGCEVFVAESCEYALAELKQYSYPAPDVLISDYRLRSKQTGIDTIRAIRDYFACDIAAIIVSGDTSREIPARAQAAGCHYLKKPIREAELLKLLASI